MEEFRLYVKNLPPGVRDDDVKEHFQKFGDISNIALKGNYGFFSVKGSLDHFEKMLRKFDQKNWNGYMITLQKSEKENFMEKLARERQSEKSNDLKETDNHEKIKVKKRKLQDSDDDDNEKIKAGVPMFSGTKKIIESKNSSTSKKATYINEADVMTSFNNYDSMWADTEQKSSLSTFLKSGSKHRDDSEVKTLKTPLTKTEKKRRDDERRKQSLANKAKEINKQKNVIQSALSNLGPKQNKIVFNDDDDANEECVKMNLFDDFEGDDENIVISSNSHFDGVAGQKLLHMQTQFNNDDRFKLDQRFLDNDSQNTKIEQKKQLEMVRYDPTKSLTNNKTDIDRTQIFKSKKELAAPVVSKEKFYEVSEGIKSSLQQNGTGFSLLATYGNKNDGDDDEPSNFIQNDEKVTKILKRNPTLLDTSDEEEEDVVPIKKWEPSINIPFEARDNFFFSENDPIFTEAFEFMNKRNSEDAAKAAENYDVTRRILRKIFKDQILKRSKKTDMFKKKIGGMKKKVGNFKTKSNGHMMKR